MSLSRLLGDGGRGGSMLPVLTKTSPSLSLSRVKSEAGLVDWSGGLLTPAEMHARAELGAARAELDREKLREVAPFPWFGKQMCFQDEFAALQVTQDGRFYFSIETFDHSAPAPEKRQKEKDKSKEPQAPQEAQPPPPPPAPAVKDTRVMTFEGVFRTPADPDAWAAQVAAMDPEKSKERSKEAGSGLKEAKDNSSQKDQRSTQDHQVASVEGHAIMRYEMEEGKGGQPRLLSVERSSWRFVITIYPFFEPVGLNIMPIAVKPSGPGNKPALAPRKRQLPYIGTTGCRWQHHWGMDGPRRERPRPRSVVLSPLMRTPKKPSEKPPRRNFVEGGSQGASNQSAPDEGISGMLRRLEMSASAPTLRQENENRWIPNETLLDAPPKQTDPQKKLEEWKEFYRQRAEELLWSGSTE